MFSYSAISIFTFFYRKSNIFKYWTLQKYNYLILLDMDLLVLMLKNNVKNDRGEVIGFQDMKGNILSSSRINDFLHENNVSLNLGFGMRSKDVPEEFIYLSGVISFLFKSISNLNKEDSLYKKMHDDINKVYLVLRELIIAYQNHKNIKFVKFCRYNEPKTLKELHVIKFLTI